MENKKTSLFTQMKPYIKGFQLPFVIAVAGASSLVLLQSLVPISCVKSQT